MIYDYAFVKKPNFFDNDMPPLIDLESPVIRKTLDLDFDKNIQRWIKTKYPIIRERFPKKSILMEDLSESEEIDVDLSTETLFDDDDDDDMT